MAKTSRAAIATFTIIALAGCGSDYYDYCDDCAPPTPYAMILSDPAFDGDITRDPATGSYVIAQGKTESVFVGIDPATGAESRAFLDFPLRGSAGVPADAVIESATIDVGIINIIPQPFVGTIQIRIDLVSFQPPTLAGTDFDPAGQPALATATITPPISQADFNSHVAADVTALLREAQRRGLADFQVRIVRDSGPVSPGLIEINDPTGADRMGLAPLLHVTYF